MSKQKGTRRRTGNRHSRKRRSSNPSVVQRRNKPVDTQELTVQNEAMTEALGALEESRDRYADLYDFAPNAYLTLDAVGTIVQANLTAAALLGRRAQAIIGVPLLGLVPREERRKMLDFIKECRIPESSPGPTATTLLNTADSVRYVQLFARIRSLDHLAPHDHDGRPRIEILLTIIDLTDQRRVEGERDRARNERESVIHRLLSAQEDERRRIARDIHDHLGQRVTGLRLILALAAQHCRDEIVIKELAEAQDQAGRLDRELDFFTRQLRPVSLDDIGLVSTLDQFVREWSATFAIPAQFHVNSIPVDVRLDPDVETNLYRITQEALNNAHKHAAPRSVSVILERRAGRVVLIIEDDGKGFNLQETDGRAGMGLMGMRERLTQIKGTLEIETKPGAGTTLFIQVPVANAFS